MKKLILGLMFLSFLGCTKDEQKTANKLEGKWQINSYTTSANGGTTVSLQSSWIEFNDCNAKSWKKDNVCNGQYSLKYADGKEELYSFTYNINEEGNAMEFKGGSLTEEKYGNYAQNIEIVDLKKESVTLTYIRYNDYNINGTPYYYTAGNHHIELKLSKLED
jgi:hypothetical protein